MHTLDPLDPDVWRTVRRTVTRGQSTSLHCSVASTTPDGLPYVSPIGSIRLGQPGCGTYLDVFNAQLRKNLEHDPRVTVMAVDSGLTTWARALLSGHFATPPGVRLLGEVGGAGPQLHRCRPGAHRIHHRGPLVDDSGTPGRSTVSAGLGTVADQSHEGLDKIVERHRPAQLEICVAAKEGSTSSQSRRIRSTSADVFPNGLSRALRSRSIHHRRL